MVSAESVDVQVCANCGCQLHAPFCGQCGQHQRGSNRLRARDIIANWAESLLDAESVFPSTLLGMLRDPGGLCRDYVDGKRKRYVNPFAYLLIALTVHLVLRTVLHWCGWLAVKENEPGSPPEDAVTWLLLVSVIPFALLWCWLFAASKRNFAENYVLGLYLVGQFAWLEALLILIPMGGADVLLVTLYPGVWLALTTWAGARFYSMPWYSVLWRMIVSTIATVVLIAIVVVVSTGIVLYLRPGVIE